MARYWVVGGIYTDTSFTKMLGGGAEERAGPFGTHDQAKAEWQRRAWATVDDAHARFRIEEEDEQAEPRFWVVGGAYMDTHFTEPAGGTEQWHGPFKTYEDAKAEWQRRAWATVDDALSRFRIEKRTSDPRQG
jgi:hypothetical protein